MTLTMSDIGEDGEGYISREGGKSCQEQLQEQFDASKYSNRFAHEESMQKVHDLRHRLHRERVDHERTKSTLKFQEAARTQLERMRGEMEDDLAASEAEVQNLRRLLFNAKPPREHGKMEALLRTHTKMRHAIALTKAKAADAKPP